MSNTIKHVALGDLENELAGTRRVLERVPDEHLGWKPHEKSFTLGELATHVTNLLYWQLGIVTSDEFDLATVPPPDPSQILKSRGALLERWDQNVAALRPALDAADDESLMRRWTLRKGEHVVMALPRVAALRTVGISHLIHHRAQLTVYLRQVGAPVPGLYGPSADEK